MMIENWKEAWKYWSVQIAILLAIVSELEWIKPHLPEHWVPIFSAMIVVSRVVSQSKVPKDPDTRAISAGLVFMLAMSGCSSDRTPAETVARQSCLLEAEANSDGEADALCHDPGLGWSTCPHREKIMSDLAKAQEDCR
jgi:hypothetical protein